MKRLFLIVVVFVLSVEAHADVTIQCSPMSGKIFINNKWEDDKISRETYFVIGDDGVDILDNEAYSYERDGFVITLLRVPTGIVFLALYSSENNFLMDTYAINEQTSTLTLTRKKSVNVNGTLMEWSSVYTGHCGSAYNK